MVRDRYESFQALAIVDGLGTGRGGLGGTITWEGFALGHVGVTGEARPLGPVLGLMREQHVQSSRLPLKIRMMSDKEGMPPLVSSSRLSSSWAVEGDRGQTVVRPC